uniref:Acyl-CoA dehydrogenase family member 10 n=1 Tax=Caenorhabditis japonica TaxID=281687 RepID=A0A8R1I2G1_CAEJA
MSEIKAVVYDFGGVILSYEGVTEKWEEMSRSLGLPDDAVHSESVGTEFSKWLGPDRSLFLGTLTVDELEGGLFLQYLKEKYGDKINDNVVVKPYTECLRGENVKLHKNMEKTVEILHRKGFKTAMLTNNMFLDKEHKETRLPCDLTHFDEVVESCLEHLMKPDLRFYQLVEQRLGVKPEEIVFLDDLPENLEAAEKLGWKTIHVTSIKKAIGELERHTNVQLL